MSVVSVVCVWKMCGMCLEGFRKVSASGLRVSGPDRSSQDRIQLDLGHHVLNGDVKEALKSSIFVVQKAAAPKTGVEFRQGSNGTIRSSLATSPDVLRRRRLL